MGEGLVGAVASYLDTQVAVWLVEGRLSRISSRAKKHMTGTPLLISPMVLIEMQYLYEIRRTLVPALRIQRKLEQDFNIRVCQLDFASVAIAALDEDWTRDAFDRIIVANARANDAALLVSSDRKIKQNYPNTIW